jgi:outer membrane immunogenic protein
MKKLTFVLCSATALISAPALAADLRMPMKAAPVAIAAPVANWNGFYIGGHIGGVFTEDRVFGTNATDSGVIGGGQLGYNWQFSQWLIGLEVSGSGSSLDSFAFGRLETLFTATGRIGYTFDRALIYAKGGYAGTKYRGFDWGSGFLVGGGFEYLVLPNVSVGAEYSFISTEPEINGTRFGRDELHKVVARVNYLFNWAAPVAVSARY